MNAEPFEIAVAQTRLDTLAKRLAKTVALDPKSEIGWDAGADPEYMRSLLDHWRHTFDWRSQEAELNRLTHYRACVSGLRIHYVHERARVPNALPLLLTHGFPDSFLRFRKLIPLLTDPQAHGADPGDAFDVVVPSLPGYAFSEAPDSDGGLFDIGRLLHELMTKVLGCERFGAHGGDWGSVVTEQLARSHSDAVVGIHLTDVPFWHALRKPADLCPAEEQYLKNIEEFQTSRGRVCADSGHAPPDFGGCPVRFAAWTCRLDRREAAALERLQWRLEHAVHQGRGAHAGHALLEHGYDWFIVSALLRRHARQSAALDARENKGDVRFERYTRRFCAVSARPGATTARMGRAVLQRTPLARARSWRALCGPRGARASGPGYS